VQQAIAGTLVNLANMEIESGKTEDASAMLDEAMRSFKLVGDSVGVTHVLLVAARIALMRDDHDKAIVTLRGALEKAWDLSAREELMRAYVLLAQAYTQKDSWVESAQLLALVRLAVRRHKLPLPASEELIEKATEEQVKKALGEKAFQDAWRSGELAGEAEIVKQILK